jgi:hypothetical protein
MNETIPLPPLEWTVPICINYFSIIVMALIPIVCGSFLSVYADAAEEKVMTFSEILR